MGAFESGAEWEEFMAKERYLASLFALMQVPLLSDPLVVRKFQQESSRGLRDRGFQKHQRARFEKLQDQFGMDGTQGAAAERRTLIPISPKKEITLM